MCMQPWFFSIGRLQRGHGLVLARIQFRFSDSALFLTTQRATVSQSTGRWASSRHWKQKEAPHAHATSNGSLPRSAVASAACSHPGAGHHDARRLSSTKDRSSNRA